MFAVACMLQFDITFPQMPCSWISLDAMDISGEMHLDVVSLVAAAGPVPAEHCDLDSITNCPPKAFRVLWYNSLVAQSINAVEIQILLWLISDGHWLRLDETVHDEC